MYLTWYFICSILQYIKSVVTLEWAIFACRLSTHFVLLLLVLVVLLLEDKP